MNSTFSWPDCLSKITCVNINKTELWFFKEIISNGNYTLDSEDIVAHKDRFGYHAATVRIGSQNYEIKYRLNESDIVQSRSANHKQSYINEIYYVQKL